MKKSLFLGILIVALAVLGYGQTAADHIKAGDEAYARFDDQKALEHYQEALKVEPQNYEALWKASRACVDIADVITATDKAATQQQQKLYTDGTSYALKAVAANPNDTWGHFQVAAALGQEAPHARPEGAGRRLQAGQGRDRQGHRPRPDERPGLPRPRTLAPPDRRDRRRQEVLRQHPLRLHSQGVVRGIGAIPEEGRGA